MTEPSCRGEVEHVLYSEGPTESRQSEEPYVRHEQGLLTIGGKMDGGRLLVVDDDPESLGIVSEALADQGYEISMATNQDEASQAIAEIRPSLVLLYIGRPGVDQHAVVHRLATSPIRLTLALSSGPSSRPARLSTSNADGQDSHTDRARTAIDAPVLDSRRSGQPERGGGVTSPRGLIRRLYLQNQAQGGQE